MITETRNHHKDTENDYKETTNDHKETQKENTVCVWGDKKLQAHVKRTITISN